MNKKKYYCKEPSCNNEISWHSAIEGNGRCSFCANKRSIKKRMKSRRSYKGKNNPAYIDNRSKRNYFCIEKDCNNKITYQNFMYGNKRCRECYYKWAKIPENNPNFKSIKIECSYANCEKMIDISPHKKNKKNYYFCCKEHFYLWRKESGDVKGENNPNWQEGKSFEEYGMEFDNALKEQIRTRDNHICQKCGITEEEHLIVYGKVLSIHHIDYSENNCSKDNLITLCNECNLRVNYNRDYWYAYFKEKVYGLIQAK